MSADTARSFGGFLELAHPILVVVLLVDERPVLAPLRGPAIAQPEPAGAYVGRQMRGVARRDRLAAMVERPGHLVLHPGGAGEQGGDHRLVGDLAAVPYGVAKFGDRGDPVVDGAPRDLEALGEALVGGAQHAGEPGDLGVLGDVDGGTAARHGDAPRLMSEPR